MKYIKEKPLHVGLRNYVWVGNRYKDSFGVDREEFCLTNDKQELVYFVEKEGFSPRNIIFQYAKEEYTDFAICLSPVEDFELIEMEQLWDIEELSVLGEYHSCDAAIIKMRIPEIAQHLFYYWIRGGTCTELFMFPSDEDLYGYFSDNECMLLNYIFREKREEFTLENFIKKKAQIAKYVDGINASRFAENYNREKHIDTLMFDYIKEELDYSQKYIFPKLSIWGT